MSEPARMVDGSRPPTDARVAECIGRRNAARWAELSDFIATRYPGIFNVEWLYGGKKYGWTLRFKKSKSFCTFIPERGEFRLLLVFGSAERQKVEQLLPGLVSHVRDDYQKSTTYHDGKWVFVNVDSTRVVSDVKQLLMLKRPPKPERAGVARRGRGKGGAR